MEAPGVVAAVPANRFAPRESGKVWLAIIHATRGKGTQASQARATINWFRDGRAFPDGSSHGSWGSSASGVVADDGHITRFHAGSPLLWRSTWAAGFGGLGPKFEWGADAVGVSLEHAQSVHLEDYTEAQYRGSARYWAWVRALQREAGQEPIPLVRVASWNQKKGAPIPRGFLGHEDLENGRKLKKSDPGGKFDYDRLFAAIREAERDARITATATGVPVAAFTPDPGPAGHVLLERRVSALETAMAENTKARESLTRELAAWRDRVHGQRQAHERRGQLAVMCPRCGGHLFPQPTAHEGPWCIKCGEITERRAPTTEEQQPKRKRLPRDTML